MLIYTIMYRVVYLLSNLSKIFKLNSDLQFTRYNKAYNKIKNSFFSHIKR